MFRCTRRGFTLTEFLVVVAIIAVVVAMCLPATRRVREAGARAKCMNHLKQLILGLHNYHDTDRPTPSPATNSGDPVAVRSFPPGCFGPGATPEERLSWVVPVLPFVEQNARFHQFDAAKAYAGNSQPAGVVVSVLLCSAGDVPAGAAVTNYVALAGIGHDAAGRPAGAAGNGFMGYDRTTSFGTIADGTANTIALAETRAGVGPWARGGGSTVRGFDPADVPVGGEGRPFGSHASGFNVALADGSVRFVRDSIDPRKLAAAITVAGGEPFDLD